MYAIYVRHNISHNIHSYILFRKKCIFYGYAILLIYLRDQVITCLKIETSIGQNDSNMSSINKCCFPYNERIGHYFEGENIYI